MLRGRPAAGLLAAAVVAAGLLVVPSAPADHPQVAQGDAVVFDHKAGNDWWVEVVLGGGASGSVQSVQAMDTGGAWVSLTKRSWGAWAASFPVEPGHQVRFRASWAGGEAVESCWFDHPSGNERCPPGGFDATFSGVKGNPWWAEVVVTANQPVRSVFLSIDCAAGIAMTHRPDWGKWVLSASIPNGAKVTFIANGDSGGEQSGGYVWPQAAPTFGCGVPPPPRFGADFRNVKGNEWWVEVTVLSREPLAGVDARVGCAEGPGAWQPLTLRSWGAWAASFRVFPGSHVDFRARAASGLEDVSDSAYVWPQATPTDGCAAPWPRDSSFAQVRFRVEDRWSDVDGDHVRVADGLVSTRFDGTRDAWAGTCEQRVTTRSPAGAWSNVTESFAWDAPPPFGEVPATVGGFADVQQAENCALTLVPGVRVVGRETRAFSVRTSSGDPVPIDAYHAQVTGTGFEEEWWWDAQHGLVLDWDLQSTGGGNSRRAEGWLLNTDASFG